MLSSLKSAARKTRKVWHLGWRQLRNEVLGGVLPLKPVAISFMANDVCNSRCQMCLIWEQKKDKEINPAQFRQILDEPLFSRVTNVGITGGEPTLRQDLPDFFRAIAERNHRITGASMITNAIREKVVQERVMECAEVCRQGGVGFSVMVSLDGVGHVHDAVRGREGNFDSAHHCLVAFREAGIPVSFGCTITKSNVSRVDELLEWAQENHFYGRFRVAEFINRLYNDAQGAFIRNFDEVERHHLGLFFARLQHEFEPDPVIRKTYQSIQGMLSEGKPRSTGCPYHSEAVILTSRGELLYCSPKSPTLGTVLERGSAARIFFGNLGKRREIRQKHCSNCIHDYHAPLTLHEQVSFAWECRRRRRVYALDTLLKVATGLARPKQIENPEALASKHVLIIGWYGTETVGDKAILWSVVERLRARAIGPERVTLASFHPFVSKHTLWEMGLKDIGIVETWTRDFEAACQEADEILIGGGPLMELQSLDQMLFAFIAAAQRRIPARVEGCGIGPVNTPLYEKVVAALLKLSSHTELRDEAALEWAHSKAAGCATHVVADPAVSYVRAVANGTALPPSTPAPLVEPSDRSVACFLRDWPLNYRGDLSETKFTSTKLCFEVELQKLLLALQSGLNAPVHFLPMNCYVEGGDDRVFARRLCKRLRVESRQEAEDESTFRSARLPASPWQIISAMQAAQFSVCMRFHAVVFAETLGVPYLALDYTNNGKIGAFLRERGQEHRLLSILDLAAGRWSNHLDEAFQHLRQPEEVLRVRL